MSVAIRAGAAAGARTAYVSRRWAYVFFLSYPVFWALGLPWLWGPAMTLPMLAYLLPRLASLRVPKGFGLWILFLGWMLISGTQLLRLGPDRWLAFAYRGNFYYTATIAFIYLYNVEREKVPYRSFVSALAGLWLVMISMGLVGVIAPQLRFTSPAAKVLPAAVLSDQTINRQAFPKFAEYVNIIGRPVPRPAAPYPSTNAWGANVALTTPFALLGFRLARRRRTKVVLAVALVAGLIPFVLSVNRGAWVAVATGILYAGGRSVIRRGGWSKILRIAAPIVLVVVAVAVSPLMDVINDRIARPHSNEGRIAGDVEATRRVLESPLLGYGTPLPSEEDVSLGHSIGTHGQLWLVMFSHGIPGAALFFGWFLFILWRTRRARDPQELWTHALVVMALVMMPFYELLSTGLTILMATMALTLRDDALGRPVPESALTG